jgi:hypothetical protein
MKKLLFSLLTAIAFFTVQAQEDIPLNVAIDFTQFDKTVKSIQLNGYLCTTTFEDPTVFQPFLQ